MEEQDQSSEEGSDSEDEVQEEGEEDDWNGTCGTALGRPNSAESKSSQNVIEFVDLHVCER